jgi:hypothetical protein
MPTAPLASSNKEEGSGTVVGRVTSETTRLQIPVVTPPVLLLPKAITAPWSENVPVVVGYTNVPVLKRNNAAPAGTDPPHPDPFKVVPALPNRKQSKLLVPARAWVMVQVVLPSVMLKGVKVEIRVALFATTKVGTVNEKEKLWIGVPKSGPPVVVKLNAYNSSARADEAENSGTRTSSSSSNFERIVILWGFPGIGSKATESRYIEVTEEAQKGKPAIQGIT